MDSNITQINKMFSKTHSCKVGQWLGKEMFHNPLQRGKKKIPGMRLNLLSLHPKSSEHLWKKPESSTRHNFSPTSNILFKKTKQKKRLWRTHVRGGRSHICRLHRSCNWWSTTGSRRRGPETCSCYTRCPWTGRGTCRTLRRRCRISLSPLKERIKDQWSPTF